LGFVRFWENKNSLYDLYANLIPRGKLMNSRGAYAAILALALLGVAISLLIAVPDLVNPDFPEVGLSLTIVCGVTALLSALVLSSFVLNSLGLSDKEEALGLPTGSVRAIIALSLILIFAIMSIFMFQYMDNPVITTTVTTTTNSTIGNQTITNSTSTTTAGPGQAMVDFTKQTLTTVGTLVVAIAAFYFGTRSVAQAQGAKEKAELFVDPIGTKKWVKGQDNPIIIVVKPTPEDAAINYKVDGDEYKSVQPESRNRFIYTPTDAASEDVTLTFEMPAYSDVSVIPLKVKIVKPELSIEPSQDKEVIKGELLKFEAKPVPKDAKVECTIEGDVKESVEKEGNKFTFTPKIDAGDVTLTFKMTEYPKASTIPLKVKVVKPELSVDPPDVKDPITKNVPFSFVAKPKPKDAEVECTIEGDAQGSVKEDPPNTFKYTAAKKGDATLTFKMPKYPNVSPTELKVKVKE
jgi:hypothetical protein